MTILLVDAGGTNLRTAWTNRKGEVWAVREQAADSFEGLVTALTMRCAEDKIAPESAIIAVAGPVQGDRVNFTNRPWSFSQAALKSALDLRQVRVMNDFAALALSLPKLTSDDLEVLVAGDPQPGSAMIAIGPGTGLGISTAVPNRQHWIALPGEGGHAAASLDGLVPPSAHNHLWQSGWLSWEEVLSGRGLVRLHHAMHPDQHCLAPEEITTAATAGDVNAQHSISCFCALLGRCASDAALLVGAWGGVFIAGGMIAAFGSLFDRVAFIDAFQSKGNYTELVRRIPVNLITRPFPAFIGMAHAAAILFAQDQSQDR
ncbi:MAG: ROK family protein [bacterium]